MTTAKKASKKTATSNTVNVLTVAQLQQAIMNQNAAYIARTKPEDLNLNKDKVNPDLARAYRYAKDLTEVHLQAIAAMGLNDSMMNGVAKATSVKVPMRTIQGILFSLTGNGNYLKGSAKAFLLGFCGLLVAKPVNKNGFYFCMTGKGNEFTSDEVKNTANARKILSKFEAISPASIKTQASVAFGKGGVGEILGASAAPKSRTDIPTPVYDSPVAALLNGIVSQATDAQIELLHAQATGK
jgi:hypothetical protein